MLAAACDLRLAADDTRFSIPEVDLGIPLAWGGIPRLVRELGPAITKELVLTCRPFTADEAAALRFVNRVVPAADLIAAAQTLADELAGKPEFALRTTKQQVNAVTEEIAGTRRNANDADTLAAALADPESRETSRRYLAARQTLNPCLCHRHRRRSPVSVTQTGVSAVSRRRWRGGRRRSRGGRRGGRRRRRRTPPAGG